MKDISFEGQVAIVTGAGRGLGRTYALELARRGAQVVVNDIDSEQAAGSSRKSRPLAELLPRHPIRSRPSTAVRPSSIPPSSASAGSMLSSTTRETCATASSKTMSLEDFDAVLNVHLRGAFCVTQPAWRLMKEQGYGRVVITSSAAGMFARRYSSNYSTAKAAIYGLCKALAFEGEEHSITINALLPRAAGSSFMTTTSPIPANAHHQPPPEIYDPLEPRRKTEAVTPLVVYLLSRACSFSGEAFSSGYGFHGRVFVGLGPGRVGADPVAVTVEDIAAHIDEIRGTEGGTVPLDNSDELRSMLRAITA